MRYLIISWIRTSNLRYVIFLMAPEAAKRLGAGGPSPGGGLSTQPGRKAFGLRRDSGVLGWELGQIQQMCAEKSLSQIKNTEKYHSRHLPSQIFNSGQVWQINAHGCAFKDPTHSHFSDSEHVCYKPRKSLHSTTCRLFHSIKCYQPL